MKTICYFFVFSLAIPVLAIAEVRPDTPNNFFTTEISSEYVNLKWDTSNDSIGYRIYRNTMPLLSVIGNEIQDAQVAEDVVYGYTISAYNNAGESKQSEPLIVRIPDRTAPIISALYPRSLSTVQSNLTHISFLTNEDAQCNFEENSTFVFTSTGKQVHIADITVLPSGEETILFNCHDVAGNKTSKSIRLFISSAQTTISQNQMEIIQKTINDIFEQIQILTQAIEMHMLEQK